MQPIRRVSSIDRESLSHHAFPLRNLLRSRTSLPTFLSEGRIPKLCLTQVGERVLLRDVLRRLYLSLEDQPLELPKVSGEKRFSEEKVRLGSLATELMIQIRKALDYNIYEFLDGHGKLIGLSEVIIKTILHFEKVFTPTEIIFFNDSLERVNLRHLNGVKEIAADKIALLNPVKSTLGQEEMHCLKLLLRLYPDKDAQEIYNLGLIGPRAFLNVYQKFISSETLFHLVFLAMGDASLPVIQKLRMLNMCCTWFSLYSRQAKVPPLQDKIKKVITAGLESRCDPMIDLAFDLSYLLYESPAEVELPSLKIGSDSIWPDKKSYRESVKRLAWDFMRISLHRILSVSPYELLFDLNKEAGQKKAPGLFFCSQNFNRVARFIHASLLELANDKGDEARNNYIYFMDVASELVELGDFPTAAAIMSAFTDEKVEKKFLKTNVGWVEGSLELTVISADGKIPKGTIKKWKDIYTLFSPLNNFQTLRAECKSRMQVDRPFIPHTATYLWYMDHILGGNPDFLENGELNVQKLAILNKQMELFYKEQLHSRENLKLMKHPFEMETDIEKHLQKKYTCLNV